MLLIGFCAYPVERYPIYISIRYIFLWGYNTPEPRILRDV